MRAFDFVPEHALMGLNDYVPGLLAKDGGRKVYNDC